jgi:hypothetical protein
MPGFLSGGLKRFASWRPQARAETEVVDARRAGPLASSIFYLLIPPFQFHQAIQRLRIIVIIIGKAGDFILVLVLPRASSRLIVILEFVVIIIRVP